MTSKNFLILSISILLVSCFEINFDPNSCECDDVSNHYYENGNNQLFIPQVFTPNEDFINDVFLVQGENIELVEITISFRNKNIYKSVTNTWDGLFHLKSNFSGKQNIIYSDNFYDYNIFCIFKNGEKKSLKGKVALITKCNLKYSCCLFGDQFRSSSNFGYNTSDPLSCKE